MLVAVYLGWLVAAPRRTVTRAESDQLPLLIVVPVFDEAPLIERKLENLAALDYAQEKRRIVIVDGGSTDGTVERVRAWIAGREDFQLLETQHRSKTAQLNEVTRLHEDARWILVTDADAQLAPDTLRQLVGVATEDSRIGVVGAGVLPIAAHALETLHWRFTDWMRRCESTRGSAAIVAASCYLTRREFVAELPSDTVADDVHVACRAMLAGLRIDHSDASVIELRSPRTLRSLIRHKYRKADAYLREILRFAGAQSQMRQPMRAIFVWRAVLLTIVPFFAVLGGTLLGIAAMQWVATMQMDDVFWTFVALVLALGIPRMRRVARGIALSVLLALVSAAALLMFPFSRQVASFPKVLKHWEYEFPNEAR
jgi:cellulose synthase/poly-beta-1,6-N-acetylglucosamine synthase-like glycosyltransferase